jgi:hypothetical protein
MAESAFRAIQFGRQSAFATAVAATTVYSCEPGSGEFTLNRATEIPDEDTGRKIRNGLAGRGSHGVRIATATMSSPLRFQDFGHFLDMTIGTAVTTGSGTYTHTWTANATSSTVKPYTVEVDDGVQEWQARAVVGTGFEIGFDTLGAGQNSMWSISADLQAADLAKGTLTAGQSAPSTLQTAEGHLTQLFEGPVGTAYTSLSELAGHLVQYRLRVDDPKPPRVYGDDADDFMSDVGAGKRLCTVSALLKISSTSVTDIFDIYNVASGAVTDRRWRIKVNGSADCSLIIDMRLEFKDIHVEPDGRDGERLLAVEAEGVYDSTNSTDLKIVTTDLVSALP